MLTWRRHGSYICRLVPTFMVGMQYWPLANLMLLRLASPGARTLGTVVAGTFWNTYLSSRLNAPA